MRLPAALLVLALTAACSSSGGSTPSPTRSPAATAAPVSTSPQTFRTPSGNVTCLVTTVRADCTPKEHDWGVYDEDGTDGCDSFSVLVSVGDDVGVRRTCQPVVDPGAKVLAYGSALQVGDVRCVSEKTAVSCARTDDGRGFTLSRSFVDPHATDAARAGKPLRTTTRSIADDESYGGFVTPTGGTVCDLYEQRYVTCHVANHLWKPTRTEEDCGDGDKADEATLGEGKGEALLVCRTDALAGGPPLGYGDSIVSGPITCTVAMSGVTCRNARTKHGFEVSRTKFRGF